MRLKEVKVSGFKSFVDGVTFPIYEGLSGIVGPNGCGKSNIFESIRWVMGANSARALRGSEMDDVIFAGSLKRPPRDIAEVILKVDNSDHKAPEPFRNDDILEVSRRIKRGSGSTYRINGKEVRAKDVQLLFADASSGANSPALVRQGQVSELINAKPENRRKVLEEASGISGLQARRHEALGKLNATENNLERVSEIIITLEDGINSLKKQATKAQKYRGLADVIKGYEAYIANIKYQNLDNDITQLKNLIKSLQVKAIEIEKNIASHETISSNIESRLPDLRRETAIAEAVLGQMEIKKFAFERDLKDAREKLTAAEQNHSRATKDITRENEILSDAVQIISQSQERLQELKKAQSQEDDAYDLEKQSEEITSKINKLEQDIKNISAQKTADDNALHNMRQILSRQKDEKNRLKKNCNRLESDLAIAKTSAISNELIEDSKNKLKAALNEIETAENNYNKLLNDLQSAEANEQLLRKEYDDLNNKINKLKTSIDALKSIFDKSPNQSSLLDAIEVTQGFEKALAAAIGDDLNAEIGKGEIYWNGSDKPVIDWGRQLSDAPTLSDFVKCPQQLNARMGAIKIVTQQIFAKDLYIPIGCRLVTKEGDLKRWDGFIKTKNAPNSQAIKLEQRNKIKVLEEELKPLLPLLPQKSKELADLKSRVQSLRQNSNNQRSRHPKLMLDVQNAQKVVNDLIAKQTRHNDKIKLIDDNIAQYKNNLEIIDKEIETASQKLIEFEAEINEKHSVDSARLEQANIDLSQLRQALADKRAVAARIKSESQARAKALKDIEIQYNKYQSRKETCETRILELTQEVAQFKLEIDTLKLRPQQIEAEQAAALADLPNATKRKADANRALSEVERELQNNEAEIKRFAAELSSIKEAFSAQSANLTNKNESLTEFIIEINELYDCNPSELNKFAAQNIGTNLESLNLEKVQAKLGKARADRENLGGVNLNADKELEEQSLKVQTLISERDELLSAIKKLRHSIDEINAEGREKLIKAFEVVNGHFSELFTTLFGGGEAYLALTETDDPLGGGLEVYACPPGKRLQSMTLMSGGEQALTAMALIFAVFLSNPAPLSIMDEIDAPLDDANVERFCALMDEMRKRTDTRFIVITHHPITMAKMDRLFGVTMMEKGVSTLVSVDLSRAETMINEANS